MRTTRLATLQGGFTLVELLVALVVSSITLLAVTFTFIVNARQYGTQEMLVQVEETVRFGLEFVKNDVRNAGRLSIINGTPTNTDPGFCTPEAGLAGIALEENAAGTPAILGLNQNDISPDRLTLRVDGSGGIPLVTESVVGATVTVAAANLQRTEEATDVVANAARFMAMFQPGFLLRVATTDSYTQGSFDLVAITARNGAARTITLGGVPFGGSCSVALTVCNGQCIVNPVHIVQYAVAVDPNDPGLLKTDLVRRTLDANALPNPLQDLVIAENVVNMQVWGMYDTQVLPNGPPLIPVDATPADDIGNWPGAVNEQGAMNPRPERVRTLHILLAARTPREDLDYVLAVDRATPAGDRKAADRTWFDVVGATPELARVATLTGEVETANLMRAGGI